MILSKIGKMRCGAMLSGAVICCLAGLKLQELKTKQNGKMSILMSFSQIKL